MVGIHVMTHHPMKLKLCCVHTGTPQPLHRPSYNRGEVSKDGSNDKNCTDRSGEEDRKASSGDGEGLTEGIFS